MILWHLLLPFWVLCFLALVLFFYLLGKAIKEDMPFVFGIFYGFLVSLGTTSILWLVWYFAKGFWA